MKQFNYESKLWGSSPVRLSPNYIQALKLKYALKALEKVEGRVLDLGCGAGNMAKAIKFYRPDLEVFGVDISKQAIHQAKKEDSQVEFRVGSAEKIPYTDETFNAVLMFDVLEHVQDPLAVLKEVNRVLKKKGVFHIFCPLEGDLKNLYGWLWKAGWKAKRIHCGHIQQFTEDSLEEKVKRSKLVIVQRKWSFHPIFSLFDIVYFSAIYLRGKTPELSVETYLERSNSFLGKLVSLLKNLVVSLGYFESVLLRNLPGGGVHLTAIKQ
jgi:SAM-dependent methyltransferase